MLAIFKRLLSLWRVLTPSGRVMAISFLGVAILYGGGKPTNRAPTLTALRLSAPATQTYAERKARNWNIRGAWKDSFWLNFKDDWRFPYSTNHLRGVEVVSYGEVWLSPFNSHAFSSIDSRVEIVPGKTRFSYELTPSNSYRFAWEKAAINRDTNNLLTASLELFRNGDTLTVTNGVVTYKERELPSEWGDPNEDGFYGNDNQLPAGADSNAYYWVDLVVSNAAAKVKFVGDKESNYPDPEFIVNNDSTNRVTLLIGKPYIATCDEAIGIVATSSDEIVVTRISENEISVVWPVEFDMEEYRLSSYALSRSTTQVPVAGGFSITSFPFLNGYYVWNMNACCTFASDCTDGVWSFSCVNGCGCKGCSFGGIFCYEGYWLDVTGLSCGCYYTEEPSATASISFSKSAVIFENCYTNAPNDVVPRRSTTNSLDITIYGGPFGGSAEIEFDDKGKLEYLTQEAIPHSISVAAEQTLELSFPFTAKEESASEKDIKASLKFTEYFTGDVIESEDEMTAVRVEVEAEADWPENKVRHVFGPAEEAVLRQYPLAPKLYFAQILPHGGGVREYAENWKYIAPASSSAMIYRIRGRSDEGEEFSMNMITLPPKGYVVFEIATNCFASAGVSGGFELFFRMRLFPLTVAFKKLELLEIPCVATNAVGYYAQDSKLYLLDHGQHGAGSWNIVGDENTCGDHVQMGINDPPWLGGGSFTWPIPNAWRVIGQTDMTNVFCNTDQCFTLESSGDSQVVKFGFIGRKKISGELIIQQED